MVSASARADAPPPDPSGVKGPAGRNGGWGGSRGQGAARWRPRRAQTRSDRAGSTILPYRMVGLNTTHSSRPALFFYPGGSVAKHLRKQMREPPGGSLAASGLSRCDTAPDPRETALPTRLSGKPVPPLLGGGGGPALYTRARARTPALLLFFSKSFFFSRRANYLI